MKQFWQYALPTVAAMLVNGLYQVVDGIFIGHYIGAAGLAGINIAWPLIGTMVGVGMMIGVGTGALSSIKQGEGNLVQAKEAFSSGVWLFLLLPPVFAPLLYWVGDDIIGLQASQGPELQMAEQYLDILIFALPATFGSIALPFLLRNDNNPNLATTLMVIGAVANIVLDYVFIAVLQWELQGAALATALAQSIVTVIGLGYFFTPYANLRLKLSDCSFNLKYIPEIFGIGLSSLFMYAYSSIMIAMHNWMFSVYGSGVTIGAYAIVGYIVTVYYLVAEGFANGMQPLVSYNFGARKVDNILKVLKAAMTVTVVGGMAFVGLLYLFPEQVVGIFNENDPDLAAQTILGMRIHLCVVFMDGFLVVAAALYQGMGLGRKAIIVSLSNILFQVPFLLLLPKYFGVEGVWAAFPLSNIALTVIVIVVMIGDLRRLKSGELLRRPVVAA
ncbi:MATE family efflux transporter [Vibrio sp. SCSIO 43136]|uniref:MATE family efflux transporter n=1 Tax=Vibrio sp. SCSIO 43136 TaxID=2819101 RepID=UPI00256EB0AD|nr:MATE family efflux transporter [Vibrio sp. SCSIO 43136]